MDRESIILTVDETKEAICADFRQYTPQIRLLCQAVRLISGAVTTARGEPEQGGAWLGAAGHRNMRWVKGEELVEYVCEALTASSLSPQVLSEICARVFHTRSFSALHPETGQTGVRIETGMEDFQCRQCGRCCRALDYRKEVTAEDVARWRSLGRTDILERVGIFERDGRETAYRIWMIPGTTERAEICPFLHHVSSENRWVCRIHDVKPAICRQYPFTRKHALMTGCPGFQNEG